jgi:hypothetical protein
MSNVLEECEHAWGGDPVAQFGGGPVSVDAGWSDGIQANRGSAESGVSGAMPRIVYEGRDFSGVTRL